MKDDIKDLATLLKKIKKAIVQLDNAINKAHAYNGDPFKKAVLYRDKVVVAMDRLRKLVDEAETMVDEAYWPIPTYIDLLFGI